MNEDLENKELANKSIGTPIQSEETIEAGKEKTDRPLDAHPIQSEEALQTGGVKTPSQEQSEEQQRHDVAANAAQREEDALQTRAIRENQSEEEANKGVALQNDYHPRTLPPQ